MPDPAAGYARLFNDVAVLPSGAYGTGMSLTLQPQGYLFVSATLGGGSAATNGIGNFTGLALQNGESVTVTNGSAGGSMVLWYSYVDYPINSSHTFVRKLLTPTPVDVIPSASYSGQYRRPVAFFVRQSSSAPAFQTCYFMANPDTISHTVETFYGSDLAARTSTGTTLNTLGPTSMKTSPVITTKPLRLATRESTSVNSVFVCMLYETIG